MDWACYVMITQDLGPVGYRNSAEQYLGESCPTLLEIPLQRHLQQRLSLPPRQWLIISLKRFYSSFKCYPAQKSQYIRGFLTTFSPWMSVQHLHKETFVLTCMPYIGCMYRNISLWSLMWEVTFCLLDSVSFTEIHKNSQVKYDNPFHSAL